ncbi:hypothetical protein IQ272_12495 [Chroococcidiopsidales cyanobacterium LEGE 13417]|nr:hypothetical protein [Chroococcidiopsidales cyanobacterium LEGE 13417]
MSNKTWVCRCSIFPSSHLWLLHPARSKARSSMAIALCHWLKLTNHCARNFADRLGYQNIRINN